MQFNSCVMKMEHTKWTSTSWFFNAIILSSRLKLSNEGEGEEEEEAEEEEALALENW